MRAPISITLHDNSVRVTGSSNVQIGNANVQAVNLEMQKIMAKIDEAQASAPEKQEARSLLERLSNNPLLAGVIGALISGGIGPAH